MMASLDDGLMAEELFIHCAADPQQRFGSALRRLPAPLSTITGRHPKRIFDELAVCTKKRNFFVHGETWERTLDGKAALQIWCNQRHFELPTRF